MEKAKSIVSSYVTAREEPQAEAKAIVQTLLAVVGFITLLFAFMFQLMR